jgi:hypothetical protein
VKSFDETIVNEIVDVQLKRKTADPSSSSTSFQDQEQMMTAVAKKVCVKSFVIVLLSLLCFEQNTFSINIMCLQCQELNHSNFSKKFRIFLIL